MKRFMSPSVHTLAMASGKRKRDQPLGWRPVQAGWRRAGRRACRVFRSIHGVNAERESVGAAQLPHDRPFALVDRLDTVAHRGFDVPNVLDQALETVRL